MLCVFDDVIVYWNTIEEHASRLEHVLERFERANLELQPSKCVFVQPQVEYLGYVISRDGIRASPEKTRAVKNFPVPRNAKECFLLPAAGAEVRPGGETSNGTAKKRRTVQVGRTSAVRVCKFENSSML